MSVTHIPDLHPTGRLQQKGLHSADITTNVLIQTSLVGVLPVTLWTAVGFDLVVLVHMSFVVFLLCEALAAHLTHVGHTLQGMHCLLVPHQPAARGKRLVAELTQQYGGGYFLLRWPNSAGVWPIPVFLKQSWLGLKTHVRLLDGRAWRVTTITDSSRGVPLHLWNWKRKNKTISTAGDKQLQTDRPNTKQTYIKMLYSLTLKIHKHFVLHSLALWQVEFQLLLSVSPRTWRICLSNSDVFLNIVLVMGVTIEKQQLAWYGNNTLILWYQFQITCQCKTIKTLI